jgi:uridine phosphorylase
MQYPSSELVLDKKGQVYHLGILPENLASNVILVGDQDRVALISALFDEIDHQSHHREFVCHTGTYKGKRISVVSTGIGTDNIDIVVNELDALVNIDLKNRCNLEKQTSLNLVRIGTCGILQADIPIHSYILSTHAYGLDNVAHFYDVKYSTEEITLLDEMNAHMQLPSKIQPYVVSANADLVQKMKSAQTFEGITVTSSGFYGPQGRTLRLGLSTVDLNDKLTNFKERDTNRNLRVMNFEMESSSLFVLGKNLGHACTTICLGIANRPNLEFSTGYDVEMNALIQYVIDRI